MGTKITCAPLHLEIVKVQIKCVIIHLHHLTGLKFRQYGEHACGPICCMLFGIH